MIGFGEVRGVCGGEGLTMLVGVGKGEEFMLMIGLLNRINDGYGILSHVVQDLAIFGCHAQQLDRR